jgi:hypothetical protein
MAASAEVERERKAIAEEKRSVAAQVGLALFTLFCIQNKQQLMMTPGI